MKIGVFDSGLGGLSVLLYLRAALPEASFCYIADSANAPYGDKSDDFIAERSLRISQFLIDQQVSAIVVACNTATAAAISQLRERYPIPLIGVEPAVKPAAETSVSGIVGVLATSGTIASDRFISLQNRFTHQTEIITRACPGLVELIEAAELDRSAVLELLQEFINPMLDKGADTLVLGCTHYSLIRELIQQVAGKGVSIVDAGQAVARETRRRLQEGNILADEGQPGSIRFLTSGDPLVQEPLFARYWGTQVQVNAL